MSDHTPGSTVTFTIASVPTRPAARKTIERLMRMQPEIRKGLKMLQHRRRITDNVEYIRAGRPWVNRARATRLVRAKAGAQFTLKLTPQIIPDIKSVEKYLTA